jgi:ComF family protein
MIPCKHLSEMHCGLQAFMRLKTALRPLVDAIFPPRCPLCGDGLTDHQGLCAACWSGLVIPGAPACSLCQRPFGEKQFQESHSDLLQCAPCMADPPRHDGVAAGAIYNAISRKLVLAFKHGGRITLAPLLSRMIVSRLNQVIVPNMDGQWILVPVPLHRWRLWRRGYNQSALLARQIGGLSGAIVVVDALQRHKSTPSLAGLSHQARLRALSGAIRINPARVEAVSGANIVLVDDVLTTGATSNACISALKRAGAARVVVACAARVMDEVLPHI